MIGACGLDSSFLCAQCPHSTCPAPRGVQNKYHVASVEGRTYKGKTFRSKLEADYACHLDSRFIQWEYEATKLIFYGKRGKQYAKLIDFKVTTPNGIELHECKGYCPPDELALLRALAQHDPPYPVFIIETPLFEGRLAIKDWLAVEKKQRVQTSGLS